MRFASQQRVGKLRLCFHLCELLCITAAVANACFGQQVTVTEESNCSVTELLNTRILPMQSCG